MITVLAVVCGVLFAVSLGIWKRVTQDTVEWYEDPFTYFALACVAVGAPLLQLPSPLTTESPTTHTTDQHHVPMDPPRAAELMPIHAARA